MNVTLLGAGAWGTAMAAQAAQHLPPGSVRLWARSHEQAKAMQAEHQNQRYLPDIALPAALQVESDLKHTLGLLRPSDLLVIATPMSGLSETIACVLQLSLIHI
jgi:glycerol-3-phosphate dehydrogenase (NAD(P)+)